MELDGFIPAANHPPSGDGFQKLAVDDLHHLWGITLALHGATRKRIFYILEVQLVQVHVHRVGILFEARHAARPRNWSHILMPVEEPYQRNLRNCAASRAGKLPKAISECEIC